MESSGAQSCPATCLAFSRTRKGLVLIGEIVLCLLTLLLHWGWSDFTRCVIGSVLFLIISLIVIISHRDGAGIAGGVFGILAGVLLGYDAYITFPYGRATPPPPLVRTGSTGKGLLPCGGQEPDGALPKPPPHRGTPALKLLRGPDAWVPRGGNRGRSGGPSGLPPPQTPLQVP
ncbi:unnamed protein product [Coccothraustes coccothraustes]